MQIEKDNLQFLPKFPKLIKLKYRVQVFFEAALIKANVIAVLFNTRNQETSR